MTIRVRRLAAVGAAVAMIMLVATTAASAAALRVSIASQEAEAGGSVDVPLTAEVPDAVGALQFDITFDPSVLSVEGVEAGSLLGGNALVEFGAEPAGTVAVAIASLDGVSGSGELVVLSFNVVGAAGDTTALEFSDARAWEGENHLEVLVDAQGGDVSVAESAGVPIIYVIAALVAVLLAIVAAAMLRRRGRS